ncbi:hypothetical protein SBA3_150001 [Candidatus Sulfopaludibacter sp. SbA3]|nr:hypothetical protein SBA3_150001 [Candidatus Sulfopaludibacter sp. SbA3]
MIWEPVLETDWGTPSQALTGQVADARVVPSVTRAGAFPHCTVARRNWPRSRAWTKWASACGMSCGTRRYSIRPGVRWGGAADLLLAPVVKYWQELAAALRE